MILCWAGVFYSCSLRDLFSSFSLGFRRRRVFFPLFFFLIALGFFKYPCSLPFSRSLLGGRIFFPFFALPTLWALQFFFFCPSFPLSSFRTIFVVLRIDAPSPLLPPHVRSPSLDSLTLFRFRVQWFKTFFSLPFFGQFKDFPLICHRPSSFPFFFLLLFTAGFPPPLRALQLSVSSTNSLIPFLSRVRSRDCLRGIQRFLPVAPSAEASPRRGTSFEPAHHLRFFFSIRFLSPSEFSSPFSLRRPFFLT